MVDHCFRKPFPPIFVGHYPIKPSKSTLVPKSSFSPCISFPTKPKSISSHPLSVSLNTFIYSRSLSLQPNFSSGWTISLKSPNTTHSILACVWRDFNKSYDMLESGCPYNPVALHRLLGSSSSTTTSMWELEQILNIIYVPSFHNMAKLPLLPSLGTTIPCVSSNFYWSPFIRLVCALVSTRKTKVGLFDFTSSMSNQTTKDDLNPRQFRTYILIGLGSAA